MNYLKHNTVTLHNMVSIIHSIASGLAYLHGTGILAAFFSLLVYCLRENEMAVLRRTERAMVRAMCGMKVMEEKRTEDLMEMLGLK